MTANFYLHPDTLHLEHAENSTSLMSFNQLLDDISHILDQNIEPNKLILSQDIDITEINGKNIYQFVEENIRDRETCIWFYNVMELGERMDFDCDDVRNRLAVYNPQETECHALIERNPDSSARSCMEDDNNGNTDHRADNNGYRCPRNPYIEFDKYELVYSYKDWLHVRRQILGNHPGSPSEFIRRCKTYFPNIVFSTNCEKAIDGHLNTIPRKIVYCLSCLNDEFRLFQKHYPNSNAYERMIVEFSGLCGMDRAASQQSTPQKKEAYTFEFEISKNTPGYEKIIEKYNGQMKGDILYLRCGLHFKITSFDNNCSQGIQGCQKRIYFAYNDTGIFVGSMGPHI